MFETELTLRALEIATQAHAGQTDKAGQPYIDHPIHVAEAMETEDETVVALLHDVVEDSSWTLDDLAKEGFTGEQVEAVAALTHGPGVTYFEYIRSIKQDPLATAVKIADLRHNSDPSRIPNPTHKDMMRLQKYARALEMLEAE
ncbi:MAG: HD domain-containing protein [Eggerthellaceae bacterium]|nr:HD domain-containing protein [Eggerthellaceae bacterium]